MDLLPYYSQRMVRWSAWRAGCGLSEIKSSDSTDVFTYFPASSGNMHSIRNSCAVIHCGVPTVVMSEK